MFLNFNAQMILVCLRYLNINVSQQIYTSSPNWIKLITGNSKVRNCTQYENYIKTRTMLIAKARTGLPLNSHSLKMGTIKMCKWKKFECPNIGNIDQHNIKGQLK